MIINIVHSIELSYHTLQKRTFLQVLESIRSMILQDLACKITTDFGTISGEIMPDES